MKPGPLENRLKEMILREELAPGERVTEAGLAERLGLSRTPIRNLLPRLAAEGFLHPVGKRGYVVADFNEQDIYDALDLRAALEGWAARRLAEAGASDELMAELQDCLAWGDRLLESTNLTRDDEKQYGSMNERFHSLIVDGCKSHFAKMFFERLTLVPFVSPNVMAFDRLGERSVFNMLHRAHGFHHAIVDSIQRRDGARAEMLFREHANHQRVSMFERRKIAPESEPPSMRTVF